MGPSVTVPRAGEYDLLYGATIVLPGSADQGGAMVACIASGPDVYPAYLYMLGGEAGRATVSRTRRAATVANDSIVAEYYANANVPISFEHRFLEVRPVRVSQDVGIGGNPGTRLYARTFERNQTRVWRAMEDVIARFPVEEQQLVRDDAPRNVEAAMWLAGAQSVLDIGGGYGYFAPLCAALGMRAVVTDTFDHPYFNEYRGRRHRDLLESIGVEFVTHDACSGDPLPFSDGTFEAVTSMDSMEHWHHSPQRLFAEVRRVSRPGALFILGVPNAVNLRKRVAVPLGKTNWSRFDDWYYEPVFRGHVREPTTADLARIAADIGLTGWKIVGRNWLGYRRGAVGRLATGIVDRPLRLRPSLCANIYLLGRFPRG